ncbi:MAG TPA: hypothetical protein VJL83_05580 [Patescibacteria group bacterium]|nr:hypothetical protein [Patescibacteria group bacterium]
MNEIEKQLQFLTETQRKFVSEVQETLNLVTPPDILPHLVPLNRITPPNPKLVEYLRREAETHYTSEVLMRLSEETVKKVVDAVLDLHEFPWKHKIRYFPIDDGSIRYTSEGLTFGQKRITAAFREAFYEKAGISSQEEPRISGISYGQDNLPNSYDLCYRLGYDKTYQNSKFIVPGEDGKLWQLGVLDTIKLGGWYDERTQDSFFGLRERELVFLRGI